MFENYRDELIRSYREKKEKGDLPINLTTLAPGKLRDECIMIYKERFSENDSETLRSFFGPKDVSTGYIQAIEHIDIDKFRPLINFIKGKTSGTERKNIELLAWLINFDSRPYSIWVTKNRNPKDLPEKDEETDIPSKPNDQPPPILTNKPPVKYPWKKISFAAAFVFIALVLSMYIYKWTAKANNGEVSDSIGKDSDKNHFLAYTKTDTTKCMYWNIDHYQTIACDQNINGISVIPFEIQKLNRLKRITRPDTLGKKDLGKTWYVKVITDSVEFYTDSGYYPLDSRKRLRPLTPYILNKYPKGYNIFVLNRFRNSK